MWEKEKIPVTSIFSFFHSVLCPIKDRNYQFIKIQFNVCKFFEFSPVQTFRKELIF